MGARVVNSNKHLSRMENLVDSEAFQKTLKSITTAEDMIRIFAQNGLEITAEDAEKFLQGRAKALEEDELAVDELDAVAGGKSRCFFHGVADGAMGRRKESDSGFFYRLGYAYGRLFR